MISNERPNFASSSSFHCDRHRRRGCNDDEIDPAPQQQLARDEPRLDGLTEPDIVCNQQIDTRETQRLAQRQKLVGIQPNACPKRRLQQITVGGCRRSPRMVRR